MIETNDLPNVGTPDEALAKMKDGYKAFLDSISKFITIAQYYTEKENEGKPLPDDFAVSYQAIFDKLKTEKPDDIETELATFTLLELDFLSDVKDNLVEFHNLETNGSNADNDYDKACDYLTIKDEFTDEIDVFNDVSEEMIEEKEALTNYNDPAYDMNAAIVEENKEKSL